MIILVNPRATRPKNRRFPLSVMAIGAALPEGESWEIVDGNLPDLDVLLAVNGHVRAARERGDDVRAIALSVMPGPQLVSAVSLSRDIKARNPDIPIVWGGNFPSLYPAPVLNSPYVDWIVRGQGEDTFAELLGVLDGRTDPHLVAGLGFRENSGVHWLSPERHWKGPDELPAPPYHKIRVNDYLRPTFLGRRSGVYQASIGCPFGCKFCGVISVFGRRERQQAPERTVEHLSMLVKNHGMDSVHFYDNNFIVGEAHIRELAERLVPLGLRWWCEARVDALMRLSDDTWSLLRRAGLAMVFCGAESGVERGAGKDGQGHHHRHGDGCRHAREGVRHHPGVLVRVWRPRRAGARDREHPRLHPKAQAGESGHGAHHVFLYSTPQRRGTYGNVDALAGTPDTLEEWTQPEWVAWMTHEDPRVPWLDRRLKARVDNFELVLRSRFPSVQDARTSAWGQVLGRALSQRRWSRGDFDDPRMLRTLRRLSQRVPDDPQAYGHLRAAAAQQQ